MSDLIERLRCSPARDAPSPICLEAAEEIVRLRSDLDAAIAFLELDPEADKAGSDLWLFLIGIKQQPTPEEVIRGLSSPKSVTGE